MLGPKENPSVKCNNQAAAAAAVRASERGRRVVSRSQNLKAHFISNGASLPPTFRGEALRGSEAVKAVKLLRRRYTVEVE